MLHWRKCGKRPERAVKSRVVSSSQVYTTTAQTSHYQTQVLLHLKTKFEPCESGKSIIMLFIHVYYNIQTRYYLRHNGLACVLVYSSLPAQGNVQLIPLCRRLVEIRLSYSRRASVPTKFGRTSAAGTGMGNRGKNVTSNEYVRGAWNWRITKGNAPTGRAAAD